MGHMKGATIGMFDGVHLGHQYLISQLKKCCDEPVVVTFGNHPLWVVTGKEEPRLLSTPIEKEALLKSEGITPVLLRFDDRLRNLTAEQFISKLSQEYGIRRLMLGFNNSIGSDRCSGADDLKRISAATGVEIILAQELPGDAKINSSAIRELIKNGDIKHADTLLGKPYTLTGKVTHGKQLGRTIGFPTANINVENSHKLIPANGVYAADAITTDGTGYRAIVNIGHRPTVDNPASNITIEAHLDNFIGNLYNQPLTLHFLTRLRDEKKFNSLADLQKQIEQDLKCARYY